MNDGIRTAVQIVVDPLVRGEYETLERLDTGNRLNASALRRAVTDYGRMLVRPPSEVWTTLDVVEVTGKAPREFDIVFPLWTAEEGESDLTLELALSEMPSGTYRTEILDLHVL